MMIRLAVLLLALVLPGGLSVARAEIAIQTVTSPGGITAWLVESHDVPFAALEIRFRGGTSLDAPGRRGAVNLMTALIEEGAGDLDAQGFAAARDGLAAEFAFSSGSDDVGVSARFLTENRDQALALLRVALNEPRFDSDAVERVRGQVLTGLRADEKDGAAIANRLMAARNFGDHPYATSGNGTIASVTALTRDDIVAAHRSALAREHIYVAAAGDITAAELASLLDDLLGGLPATGAPLPVRAKLLEKGGLVVADLPGPQSVVQFVQKGIAFEDPDYFAVVILNEILGGGRFGARLMTEVRETRGLTYGIGTGLASLDHAEWLVGQFESANSKVAEAIDVVRAEWAKIAAVGVTADELDKAKAYLTGSYPLRFDGNGQIAGILVGMQMVGLTPDYPAMRNARIEAVTPADVKRVAASFFTPDKLFFTVVGQPEGVIATE